MIGSPARERRALPFLDGRLSMKPAILLWLILLAWLGPAATAGAADTLALLPFALENTSLEPTRPDEQARLAMLHEVVAARLREAGYELVDLTPVAADIAARSSIRGCNGCELGFARKLGASLVAFGWVQKVSNLILNINLMVRDVATGGLRAGGSVDIRGNTDESWRRGGLYLLKYRILPGLAR